MDDTGFRKIFSSLPQLETQRLILRKIVMENADDMYEYASLSEVTRYLLWSPHLNINSTRGYIEYLQRQYKKGEYGDWGLNLKAENKFIGTIGFANLDLDHNFGEIGYVLNPNYQGKGLMKEALKPVVALAFEELKLKRLQARIIEGNVMSEHFIKSMGFQFEGKLRHSMLIKGKYCTICYYSLLNDEYFAAK